MDLVKCNLISSNFNYITVVSCILYRLELRIPTKSLLLLAIKMWLLRSNNNYSHRGMLYTFTPIQLQFLLCMGKTENTQAIGSRFKREYTNKLAFYSIQITLRVYKVYNFRAVLRAVLLWQWKILKTRTFIKVYVVLNDIRL